MTKIRVKIFFLKADLNLQKAYVAILCAKPWISFCHYYICILYLEIRTYDHVRAHMCECVCAYMFVY